MTQSIQLSLPLSATALRLGSAFLSDLAAQSEVIQRESEPKYFAEIDTRCDADMLPPAKVDPETGVTVAEALTAPATTQVSQPEETPEQRQYRLHGNVASAGMEPPVQVAEPNPVQYETVVIGHKRNPDYAGTNAAFDEDQLAKAGWTTELLVQDGYLIPVTEQRPLAVAPGASSPAPAPAPVPPAATGSTVELDADGLPWDSRIHSDATVRKAATGKWKTRKNLAAGYKEQIEAELRQVMAASPNTAITANVSVPAPSPAAPPAPVAAPPAPAPAAAPAAPSPAGNGAMTFADFTRYLVSNKVDQGKVMVQVQKVGLTSIPDLAKRPDLIPAVVEGLKG